MTRLDEARLRVAMADVDAAAILYFATPYRWQELLFTGWMQSIGHPVSGLLGSGSGCPAVHSSCSYLRPLRLDDFVRCELSCDEVGRTSFEIALRGYEDASGELAVQTATRHVWVEGGAATPVPHWLRSALTQRGAQIR
jgi:acyl-CoA thioesterase FadM